MTAPWKPMPAFRVQVGNKPWRYMAAPTMGHVVAKILTNDDDPIGTPIKINDEVDQWDMAEEGIYTDASARPISDNVSHFECLCCEGLHLPAHRILKMGQREEGRASRYYLSPLSMCPQCECPYYRFFTKERAALRPDCIETFWVTNGNYEMAGIRDLVHYVNSHGDGDTAWLRYYNYGHLVSGDEI